jgi:hypothetical protein
MRLAVGIVGLLLLVFAGLRMATSLRADIDDAVDDWDAAEQEYEMLGCLGDRVLAAVPVGATVAIAMPDLPRGTYWFQRIWELTSPERTVTEWSDRADFVVRVVASASSPCGEVDVMVMEQ